MKQTDLLIYRQYEKRGIKVIVKIDRLEKTVSLVEYDRNTKKYIDKKWEFFGRELKYMNGWLAILDVMQEAIKESKVVMESFKDEDTKKLVDFYLALEKFDEQPNK